MKRKHSLHAIEERLQLLEMEAAVQRASLAASLSALRVLVTEPADLTSTRNAGWRPRSGVKVPDVGSARLHL